MVTECLLLPMVAFVTAIALGAWAAGDRRQWARGLAFVCATVAVIAPAIVPGPRLLRFLMATAGMMAAFRFLDLIRDDRDWPLALRLALSTSIVDLRRLEPITPHFPLRKFFLTIAYCLLVGLGYGLAFYVAPTLHRPQPIRWLGGVLLIYGVAEIFNHGAQTLFNVTGRRPPPLHHAPILARSVAAFWSRHYNLSVSAWLGRHCLRPMARRGHAGWGLALAFVVSAAFHAWLAWVPLGARMAASMGAFFLVQAVAVGLERLLCQGAWPRPLQHLWTLAWMLGSAPLFVEPFLRIVSQ